MFPLRDLNPTRIFPIITLGLIAVNVVIFFAWQPSGNPQEEISFLLENAGIACELTTGDPITEFEFTNDRCIDDNATPLFPEKNIWLAAFVSMFLHGGIGHLLSNMWFLWIFGNNVEEAYGTLGYLLLYLIAGVGATATFVLANPEATVPLIGASGAIAGVLGAYLVLFPTHRILTLFLFFFVQIPAGAYLAFWFLLQFAYQQPGVAWEAHVGGFIVGVLLTLPLRQVLLARVRRLHQPVRRAAFFR
ncbi:MAG: rhomboid family intramembrane serine protease [Acidimicrobiia bacterium]|nr:rhomboid family intramembrane serine protease [Acidimicrobiia bacterium]